MYTSVLLPCWQPLLLDLPVLSYWPACLPLPSSSLSILLPVTAAFYISLSASLRSGVDDFLLQGSPALNGLSCVCHDPLLPLPPSASQAGFPGLCMGYSDLLPQGIDVYGAGQRMFFSICQCLKLVLQLESNFRYSLSYVGSFILFMSHCCLSQSLPVSPFPQLTSRSQILLALRESLSGQTTCLGPAMPF